MNTTFNRIKSLQFTIFHPDRFVKSVLERKDLRFLFAKSVLNIVSHRISICICTISTGIALVLFDNTILLYWVSKNVTGSINNYKKKNNQLIQNSIIIEY